LNEFIRRHYLDWTISDEMILQIAEVMFWCKKMCLSYPLVKEQGYGDLTEEVIYIGCIYLLKSGLKKGGEPIIPKFQLLSKRGFLVAQNELTTYLANRRDASKGPDIVTNILMGYINNKILPVSDVSFLNWKLENSQLDD
jgi:hypothetical protein